jgi:hypothetical protein
MANKLIEGREPQSRIIPPTDKLERQRFWIERGNQLLIEQGRHDLEWVCRNGSYSIEPRRAKA